MSKRINNGGPAFAAGAANNDHGWTQEGMSMRDWFAGQALAGIYACRDLQLAVLHDMAKTGSGDFEGCMAKQAYSQADVMIAAKLKAEEENANARKEEMDDDRPF